MTRKSGLGDWRSGYTEDATSIDIEVQMAFFCKNYLPFITGIFNNVIGDRRD
jgi:hypothetical protein